MKKTAEAVHESWLPRHAIDLRLLYRSGHEPISSEANVTVMRDRSESLTVALHATMKG